WRNRQVEQRSPAVAKRAAKRGEDGVLAVVAGYIRQATRQVGKDRLVYVAARGDALPRTRAQLLMGPWLPAQANHGNLQAAAPCHFVQRGKDLLVGEVARRAEKDEGIGQSAHHPFPPGSR